MAMRWSLAQLVWAVALLGACAAPRAPAVAGKPAPEPVRFEAREPLAYEELLALLPADAALVVRVQGAEFRRHDALAAVLDTALAAVLDTWPESRLAETRRLHFAVGVSTLAALPVTAIVETAHSPGSAFAPIGPQAWSACVHGCQAYVHPQVSRGLDPSELRGQFTRSPEPGELLVAHIGSVQGSDPAHAQLRERLLDSAVPMASELLAATIALTRRDAGLEPMLEPTLELAMHARFTSRGVASSASLLTRGALFEVAEQLEAAGALEYAEALYAVQLALTEDGLTVQLTVPEDSVPALALAWRAAHGRSPANQSP